MVFLHVNVVAQGPVRGDVGLQRDCSCVECLFATTVAFLDKQPGFSSSTSYTHGEDNDPSACTLEMSLHQRLS